MSPRTLGWLGMAACALLPLAAQAALLVTDVSGRAEFEGRTVQLMAELPEGATLVLAAGAKVVAVDLGSGREYILKAPGRYTMEKAGPKAAGGGRIEGSALPGGHLPDVRIATGRVAQATLVMRSVRKGAAAVSPHKTAVATVTPTLHWPESAEAADYRVTIDDASGNRIFESTVPPAPTFVLPAGAKLKAGGRYTWRVEARRDGRKLAEHGGEFSVLGDAELRRLAQFRPADGADFSRRSLYAALLMEAGATEEARALWQALRAERPDDPSLARLAD